MEAKDQRKRLVESEEEPRHTRFADVYNQHRGALFQGWGPKL